LATCFWKIWVTRSRAAMTRSLSHPGHPVEESFAPDPHLVASTRLGAERGSQRPR
jgi:hypothetical protein